MRTGVPALSGRGDDGRDGCRRIVACSGSVKGDDSDVSVDQRAAREGVEEESKKGVVGVIARTVIGGETVADDQRLLMGRDGLASRGTRLIRDAISGARLNSVLSTDMQGGTTVVQIHGGALHREERGGSQKAKKRTCIGAGARCREGTPLRRGMGYRSNGSVPLAVIEQGARPYYRRVARLQDSIASLLGVARRSLSLRCHMADAVQDRSNHYGVSHGSAITHLHTSLVVIR